MRFCNGIPNDRYRIVADENRWQVGYASPFRDGRGGNVFRPGTAAHGWRALTFPPAPFLSPAGGEEGGGHSLSFPLAPFLSHTGSGRGDVGGLARKHGGPRTQWLRAGSAGLWPAS